MTIVADYIPPPLIEYETDPWCIRDAESLAVRTYCDGRRLVLVEIYDGPTSKGAISVEPLTVGLATFVPPPVYHSVYAPAGSVVAWSEAYWFGDDDCCTICAPDSSPPDGPKEPPAPVPVPASFWLLAGALWFLRWK